MISLNASSVMDSTAFDCSTLRVGWMRFGVVGRPIDSDVVEFL